MIKIKEFLSAVNACRRGRKLMKSAGSFRRAWERAGYEDLSYAIYEVSYQVQRHSTSSKMAKLAEKVHTKLNDIADDQWHKEDELAKSLNIQSFGNSFYNRPDVKALTKKVTGRIRAEIPFDDLMVLAEELVKIDKAWR